MNSTCAIGTHYNCAFFEGTTSRFGKPLNRNCLTQDCRFCTEFRDEEICYFCNPGFILIRNGKKQICEIPKGNLIGCVQIDDPSYCGICDFGYVKNGLYCARDLRSDDEFQHNHSFLILKMTLLLILLPII